MTHDLSAQTRRDGAPEHVIEAIRLSKRYGNHEAVREVSFSVRRGEVLGLLGPNGAGKSTTVEMLTGTRLPSHGTARILGQDPAKAPPSLRARIGVVAQSTNDIERATSREILRHFASLYPSPRNVEEVLDACGLSPHAGKRIRRLSGGQRRRLDVALAIIGKPEALFLDEPTTGFDPEARQEFWALIEGLRDAGTAILLTSHDLHEAERLSDRIGIIVSGALVELGRANELGGAGSRIPIVSWRENGEVRERRTSEPSAFIAALMTRLGGEPEQLRIQRPELHDIYLDLIAKGRERTADREHPAGLERPADREPTANHEPTANRKHPADRKRATDHEHKSTRPADHEPPADGNHATSSHPSGKHNPSESHVSTARHPLPGKGPRP